MIVQDILGTKESQQVATTTTDRTVADAAQQLSQRRIGALVVINDARHIVGILSERDIVRGLAGRGAEVMGMRVGELMTSAVLTCHPHDSIETLMATMTANRVRHLPVEEDHRLAGIITIGDVVKARLQEATMEVDQMREYVAAPR